MEKEPFEKLNIQEGGNSIAPQPGGYFPIAEEDIAGCDSTPIGLGEGQTLLPSPIRKKKEADEAYFNDGTFDDDQELALQIAKRDGSDISEYVTSDNSPEQMFELMESVTLGIPPEKIKVMADPSISYMALQAINKAWKAKIDLTGLLPWADPFVLRQALLGAQKGLDLSKFIKQGLDHRQIEQLRKELEAGGDPSRLSGDYNKMRAKRFPQSNISNSLSPVKRGEGVSGKKAGKKN